MRPASAAAATAAPRSSMDENVAPAESRVAAAVANRSGDRFARFRVDVHERHARAFLREAFADRAPDAVRRARDHRHLAAESVHGAGILACAIATVNGAGRRPARFIRHSGQRVRAARHPGQKESM